MEKTLQDHLLRALNELESNSFKSYQNKLTDCRIKEGYERIPRGKLENKDREDLVKLIFQYYGDSYGPELTVGVLKAINENNVAADLQKLLGKAYASLDSPTQPSTRPHSPGETLKTSGHHPGAAQSSSASGSSPKMHFVDEHQRALINVVSHVAPILDSLDNARLLTSEAYDTIMNMKTTQAQMRELYRNIRSWKDPQKDILKNAIRESNPGVVENLEQSQP